MIEGRHVECASCGTIGPEEELRNIPTFVADEETYVDGYYCEEHARVAIAAALVHIASLDLEDDERNDMMPLMMLLALLRARDQREETLPPRDVPGEGMERIKRALACGAGAPRFGRTSSASSRRRLPLVAR